jgi:hypothetical protein
MLSQLDPVHIPTSHFLKIHLLANSLAATVIEPARYRLLTLHVPNLISHFGCTRVSVQFGGLHFDFRNMIYLYGEELLLPRPIPKLEDHTLSAVRDCLLNISNILLVHVTLSSRRHALTSRTAPPLACTLFPVCRQCLVIQYNCIILGLFVRMWWDGVLPSGGNN